MSVIIPCDDSVASALQLFSGFKKHSLDGWMHFDVAVVYQKTNYQRIVQRL